MNLFPPFWIYPGFLLGFPPSAGEIIQLILNELDNPTNFFTAQSLDSRAGDINNLLDGIGNGVQFGVHAAFCPPDLACAPPFFTHRLDAVRCAFR